MAKKRPRFAAARNRIRPAYRWGAYLVAAMLLLLGVTVAASQMLWASASPAPTVSSTESITSPAANGEVVSRAVGGDDSAQTLNLYGGGMRPLVEERDGVQTLNIYGPGGRIIAQVVRDGQGAETVRYLLTDHLGSTRVVVDAEGNAVARYEYAPHGETTVAGSKGAEVRYRYTGHRYDEGQDVYETPNRGYEPTLGRFLSVDPQREDASPYVYAGNNPVGYLDPSGGVKVPFFMQSGMEIVSNNISLMAESIATGFGLQPGQKVRNATKGFRASTAHGRRSYVERRPEQILWGSSEQPDIGLWEYSDKLYWFIGKDEPVTLPDRLQQGLETLRKTYRDRVGSGIASEIVLIDFTGDENRSAAIMEGLSGTVNSLRLVKADIVPGTNHFGTPIAKAITHGSTEYDLKDFGAFVGAITDPDQVTPLVVPGATQFEVPTVIQRVEQDTRNLRRGLEGGATSQSKVPKSDLPSTGLLGTDALGDVSLPFPELPE